MFCQVDFFCGDTFPVVRHFVKRFKEVKRACLKLVPKVAEVLGAISDFPWYGGVGGRRAGVGSVPHAGANQYADRKQILCRARACPQSCVVEEGEARGVLDKC